MCRYLAIGAMIVACALAPSSLRAQVTDGFYVAAGGGSDWMRHTNATTNTSDGARFTFEAGWTGLGAVGYGFGNGLRLEAEIAYRRNALDTADGQSGAGAFSAHTAMVNALYDVSTGTGFTPYVGVGAGMAQIRAVDFVIPDNVAIKGSNSEAVYQGIGGVAYPLGEHFKLDLGYRYLVASQPEFSVNSSNGGGSRSADISYRHQAVLLVLRYEFGPGTKK